MQDKLVLVSMGSQLKYKKHTTDVVIAIKKAVADAFGLNLSALRGDIQLILYIANLIETLLKPPPDKKCKVDKLDLLIDIMRALIPSIDTVVELDSVKKIVEFLHSNNSIVAVTKTAQRVSKIGSFFLKKFI
jgi:hypothetical protein